MTIAGWQLWGAAGMVALLGACGEGAERADGPPEVVSEEVVADPPGSPGTDVDRRIFQQTVEWALSERLDTLPIGRSMVLIGERFVGTPYTPGTLEQPGGERLVVNLRELDCVTFVENVLALARVVRSEQPSWNNFLTELERIRYRDGTRGEYPTRLHYFSEWISDNEELGLVREVTQELGGVPDAEVIDFMSSHADKYPALADAEMLAAIREMEARLNQEPRYYVPEDSLAEAMEGVEEGDIIAATSVLPGLDVAHTGIAVLRNDRIHLMHAPLVGDSVEVSEQPLDVRIQRIEGQDGIMVARPL